VYAFGSNGGTITNCTAILIPYNLMNTLKNDVGCNRLNDVPVPAVLVVKVVAAPRMNGPDIAADEPPTDDAVGIPTV
jgi:hypothetical protein